MRKYSCKKIIKKYILLNKLSEFSNNLYYSVTDKE